MDEEPLLRYLGSAQLPSPGIITVKAHDDNELFVVSQLVMSGNARLVDKFSHVPKPILAGNKGQRQVLAPFSQRLGGPERANIR